MGGKKMKMFAAAGLALSAIALGAAAGAWSPANAQAQAATAKLCDNPRQMDGFKTCANVDKAKAEGAFTLYSTDPEQGQVKLLAAFNKMFPEIKTSYVRLQAGALYAKVLSERQAKSYLVDVIQISDMGMILDFQRRGGFRQYISPQMEAFKKEYKSSPEGFWTWGSIIMAGIAYNPNNVPAAEAPKTWQDLLDPKWKDAINVKVSNSGLQHGVWYVLKPILGLEYFKKFAENKPRANMSRLASARPSERPIAAPVTESRYRHDGPAPASSSTLMMARSNSARARSWSSRQDLASANTAQRSMPPTTKCRQRE